MSKVMLVNVSHEEESRVAIVQGGVLESLEIESVSKSLKGNIYKGIVHNVNVALEAAFVDYGEERAAFLPLDEVNFKVLPVLPGREGHGRRITDHVAQGREILVQVVRDAFNSKPPTVTTFYSLPGRYLVLTPRSDGQGISRKIEDATQRDRLRKIVEELNPPEGFGLIVRTAGMDQSKTELQRDLRYLLRLWQSIEAGAEAHRAPSLIYQERDIVLRTIRDHFTPDIEEVLIDDETVYGKAKRFVQAVMPTKEKVFRLYAGDKPLFTKYNLEDQIETIFKREVTLKSGGAIVIDETEALTAIDVNSGRSAREANIEDTALKTNLEAAEEAARQLRLRDLGGLIVVDFIDMYQSKNVRAVEKTMREALRKDKAKYDAGRISKFGLMEISRQRLKVAKASAAYVACARCEGTGVVKTTEAAALSILRRIQARVVKGDLAALKATVPEEIAIYLLNQKRDELSALERRYQTRISLIPHPTMNPGRGEIETTVREPVPSEAPIARVAPAAAGPAHPPEDLVLQGVPVVEAVASVEAPPAAVEGERDAAAGVAPAGGPAREKKRRRRRRRPQRQAGGPEEAAGAAEPAEEGELAAPATLLPEAEGAPSAADVMEPEYAEVEPHEEPFLGWIQHPPTQVGVEPGGGEAATPHESEQTPETPTGSAPGAERLPQPAGAQQAGPQPDAAPLGRRRRRRHRRRPHHPAGPAGERRPADRAAFQNQERPSDSPGAPGESLRPSPAGPGAAARGRGERERTPSPSPGADRRPTPPPERSGTEEDIPGGWWQRLTGGSGRGGRGGEGDSD